MPRIVDLIKNTPVPTREKAGFKGKEIANRITAIPRVAAGKHEIEIVKTAGIKNGVEVLVKAWKGGEPVGFGKDGSVEIERIRIINPPILVDDPAGDIVRTWTEEFTRVNKERVLREDPREALLQSLDHTLSVLPLSGSKKIVKGKIGSTVTTVYPEPNPETTAGDSNVYRHGVNETFSTIRAGAGTGGNSTGANIYNTNLRASTTTNQFDFMTRGIFSFDTSSIPDTDTIDSATFSIRGAPSNNGIGSPGLDVVGATPADPANIVAADYTQTDTGGTRYATTIPYSSYSTTGYNDFTLNASGLANISKTGVSSFATVLDWDFDNSFGGTWSSGAISGFTSYFADQTGTSNDPKLVITHSAGSTFIPKVVSICLFLVLVLV